MSKFRTTWSLVIGLTLVSACSEEDGGTVRTPDAMAGTPDTMAGTPDTMAGANPIESIEDAGGPPIDENENGGDADTTMNGGPGEMPMEATPDDATPDADAPALLAFKADVSPIFVANCGPCHARGGHADPEVNVAYASVTRSDGRGTKMFLILDRIGPNEPKFGSRMPPSCRGPAGSTSCLREDEYQTVVAWYDEWLAAEDGN